jgi:tRNA nucleotidyltransferase (CCA-adding enzyme)
LSEDLLERLDHEHHELLRACGRLATDRGECAYLVGGSVRDLVVGRTHDDLDIVVEGDGLAVAQALSRSIDGRLTRHHTFRTATVTTPSELRVDVATARKEEYPRPGQLPQVVAGSLDDDLMRRDFTINTMAIALAADDWGRFIDPLDGLADLTAGRVRVMHSRSFADDPTRVLRALRFAARFGFEIDADTHAWMREAVVGGYLDGVSGDRVRKELRLTFSEAPISGPVALQADGVLAAIQQGLVAQEAVLSRLQELLDGHASSAADPSSQEHEAVAWVLVLSCCAAALPSQDRWELVRRLRLSRQERAPLIDGGAAWRGAWGEIESAGASATDSVRERALRHLDPGALLVVAALAGAGSPAAEVVRHYLGELRWVRPQLGGEELKAMGVPEGPMVGELLERLRAARLDGEAENNDDERSLITAWMAENPR